MTRRRFEGMAGISDNIQKGAPSTSPLGTGHEAPALIPDPCSLFPASDKLREECGVVAIHGHPDAARETYLGLYALQHRGQESAGIATADGHHLANIKGMGLVS